MFNKTSRMLTKYNQGSSIQVSIQIDDDGYFDRHCSACSADFKVLFEDWKKKVSDEKVFCPICRHEDTSNSWNTIEQQEYFNTVVLNQFQREFNEALRDDARNFNHRQKPGFISLSLSVKPSSLQTVVPLSVADVMKQKFTCEICGCRYASIGLAYFCPACSHNSILNTFQNTIDTVNHLINSIPDITRAFETIKDEDVARDSVRNILEDSLCRLVGAFQHFSEHLFNQKSNAQNIKQRKNVFQNLADSSDLWKQLTGKRYEDLISKYEYDELEQLFQKRHLLAHRNGIVDQDYIKKSGDTTYAIGQRLIITDTTVLRLADILLTLSLELKKLP